MGEDKIRDLAKKIIKTLGETDKEARGKIYQIVDLCGSDLAEDVLQETLTIEAGDGMMTLDGKRRRTAGGVFFHLIRPRISSEHRKTIFWRPRKKKSDAKPATENNEAVDALSPEQRAKLKQLEDAASTLRLRISELKQDAKETGVKMTERLLANTERQIEKLKQDAAQ